MQPHEQVNIRDTLLRLLRVSFLKSNLFFDAHHDRYTIRVNLQKEANRMNSQVAGFLTAHRVLDTRASCNMSSIIILMRALQSRRFRN